MKQKVKALTNRMCCINYKDNGYDITAHGIVRSLFIVCFNFKINDGNEIKIRFESVQNIEAIK